jgi:hypothetical protein
MHKHCLLCKHTNRTSCGQEDWVRTESDSSLTLEKLEVTGYNQRLSYLVLWLACV